MLTVHGRTEFTESEISHIKNTLATGDPIRIRFTFKAEPGCPEYKSEPIPEGLVMLDFLVVMHEQTIGEVLKPVYIALELGGVQYDARKALEKHPSPWFKLKGEMPGASYDLNNIIGGMQYNAQEHFAYRHG